MARSPWSWIQISNASERSRHSGRGRSLQFESLEPRQLLTTVTLGAHADTNIEESGPNDIEGDLPRMQVRSRDVAGTGRQHISYVRFNLSSVGEVDSATFSVITQNATNWLNGQLHVVGLNDVAGNTPQNWVEAGGSGLTFPLAEKHNERG